MPFGVVGRAGTGMGQVVGFDDRSTERGNLGAYMGRLIVTNGDLGIPIAPLLDCCLVNS